MKEKESPSYRSSKGIFICNYKNYSEIQVIVQKYCLNGSILLKHC